MQQNKMKVLFVSEYWEPCGQGGGEKSTLLLAKTLLEQGVEVHVLTSHFKKLKRYEKKEGIYIHRNLKTGKNPESFFSNLKRALIFKKSVKQETKKIVKNEKYDILHYFNSTSADGVIETTIPKVLHLNSPVIFDPKGDLVYGDDVSIPNISYYQFSTQLKKSKTIGKMKNRFYLKYNPLFKRFLYSSWKNRLNNLENFDYFIPLSYFIAEILQNTGINKNKIAIVPNIVETERFTPTKDKSNTLKIIYIGSYSELKGVYILLEELTNLKRDYICDFYGSGTEEVKMKKIVEKNKLKVKINKEIKNEDVPNILSKYNVLILPSVVKEAKPRVLLEAMASELIPIASNVGGVKEIIKNEKLGRLFNPTNKGELKNILEEINLKKFNKKLLRNEAKKYNSKSIGLKVLKIYKELIKKKSTTS